MSDLPSLLPPNAGTIERDLEQLTAPLNGISAPLYVLWNPDLCPSHLLPYLAWALSLETWDPNWSDETKRVAIKNSVRVHRMKGTIGAVKTALASAGYGDAKLIERFGWEFYDGSRTHDGATSYLQQDLWAEYRVQLVRPITIEQASQVRAILSDVAPVRCHLKALDFTEALNIYDARITHDGQFTHGVA